MAQKARRKQKAYQDFCRSQVKSGRINNDQGQWVAFNETSGEGKNMHRDQRAGYKLNK